MIEKFIFTEGLSPSMIENLKRIGFTDGEARVYSAMLKKGSSTVGPLVKESGVAYSKIYEVIERLMKRGLVTFIKKEKIKHFQVTNPENLNSYLQKKQEDLDGQKQTLTKVIKDIRMISLESIQEAEVFTGLKGLTSAYELMLADAKKGEDFLFFLPFSNEHSKTIEDFYSRVGPRFRDSGVTLKGISNESHRDSKIIKQQQWSRMRFVGYPLPSTVDIFKDRILFISWNNPAAFLIQSQELADQFRKYFYTVWAEAKP